MARMSERRRSHYEAAMERGEAARRCGALDEAFTALGEAHILGQPWMGPHLRSHWAMLHVGLLQLDFREVGGQLLRLALVAPGTWLDRLPLGNHGRARVSAFKPMPIPERLRLLLED